MVVDDSLTVRKITGRLLERSGYRVVTVRDGVEALERLRELVPQAMVVDIEMPRMDGFELTRKVRSDPRLAGIPIVMITSRTAHKHEQHARDTGVDAYLGKPYQEEELLRHIAQFVAGGRGVEVS
jgi:chemosensory pili system protein ChpA (sensor histidine kinase/response regulator)